MDILVGAIGALILAQLIDGRVAFALGFLAVVAIRLVRRGRARKSAQDRRLGLRTEEAALVQEDLQRGDRESAVARIASAQARQRADLQAVTGVDLAGIVLDIGRDISWSDILRHVFRVCEFNRAGTTMGPKGEVQTLVPFSPYGFLLVESPILNMRASLPITHRNDFLLAASVYDDPRLAQLAAQEELLVTYVPKRGPLGSILHVLHYVIVPHGTLERYYAMDDDIHMRKPDHEKLFGRLVYVDDLRVQVDPHPGL